MLLKLLVIASNEANPHEELLLNVIAASTNISYYASMSQVDLSPSLPPLSIDLSIQHSIYLSIQHSTYHCVSINVSIYRSIC